MVPPPPPPPRNPPPSGKSESLPQRRQSPLSLLPEGGGRFYGPGEERDGGFALLGLGRSKTGDLVGVMQSRAPN